MATDAILTLGGLVLLACLFYGPWQALCTDWTRQVLFETRDKIFDIAADGRISFRSEEYRTIRASIEKNIRFAHRLSLPRMLVMLPFLERWRVAKEKSDLQQAVDRIADLTVRGEIKNLVADAQKAVTVMAFLKSPVILVSLPILIVVGLAALVVGAVRIQAKTWVRRAGEIVQLEAECA